MLLVSRTMDSVRILISYKGWWNELPDGSERYVGALNKGVYVRKNLTYEELLGVVKAIVKYDPNRYEIDIQSISVGPDSTCRTMIADDDDVQFLLGEDSVWNWPYRCIFYTDHACGSSKYLGSSWRHQKSGGLNTWNSNTIWSAPKNSICLRLREA